MDFGDILSQWEQGKGASAGKSSPASAANDSAQKAHPMEAWLRSNKIVDKDAQAGAERDNDDAAERRRRLRLKRPDDFIDIHGLTRDEAWAALEQFFENSRSRGMEKVLIIHGKGNHSKDKAVLKHCVREFIEKCSFAGESGRGDTGGSGATWVLLKHGR